MPKATMYKNHFLSAPEDQIGFAGKLLSVQAVSEAATVHKASYQKFGFCITSPNPRHSFAALSATQSIHCDWVAVS